MCIRDRVSRYIVDFLPLSIGMGSRTASLRSNVSYSLPSGPYLSLQAGYTARSRARLERDAYLYAGRYVESDRAMVPALADATLRLGYLRHGTQADVFVDYTTGTTGDDIRYNDMPFVTNKMQALSVGGYAKRFIGPRWAVQAGIGRVVRGRNAGRSTQWSAGASYQFPIKKSSPKTL